MNKPRLKMRKCEFCRKKGDDSQIRAYFLPSKAGGPKVLCNKCYQRIIKNPRLLLQVNNFHLSRLGNKMLCPYCGSPITSNHKECPFCKIDFIYPPATYFTEIPQHPGLSHYESKKEKKELPKLKTKQKKKWTRQQILSRSVFSIIGLAVLIFIVLSFLPVIGIQVGSEEVTFDENTTFPPTVSGKWYLADIDIDTTDSLYEDVFDVAHSEEWFFGTDKTLKITDRSGPQIFNLGSTDVLECRWKEEDDRLYLISTSVGYNRVPIFYNILNYDYVLTEKNSKLKMNANCILEGKALEIELTRFSN